MKYTVDVSGVDSATSLLVDRDGALVIAGVSSPGGESSFSLVRYLANGSLDLSFGSSGKAVSPFSSGSDYPTRIAQQPDGKYVVAGEVSSAGAKYAAVARYNADGSVDSSFGTSGLAVTPFPFLGSRDGRLDIQVQADGKLVLGHSIASSGNSGQDFLVARLTQSGALDSSFSGIGYAVIPINPFTGPSQPNDFFQSLVVQPDGKILVGGTSWMYSTPRYFQFAAARLDSNGLLDAGFSAGNTSRNFEGSGKLTADLGRYDDDMSSIVLQSSGKIVLIGASETSSTGNRNPVLTRYDNNGNLDATFGNSGVATLTIGSSAWPTSAVVGSDDSIFFAGRALSGGVWKPFVSKVNPTGRLDTSFGSSGVRYLEGSGQVTDIEVFGNNVFVSVEDGSRDFVWYRLSGSGVDAPFPTVESTYNLVASGGAVNEGSSATFTLSTTNVAAGTAVAYTVSGVSSGDIVGGALSGSVNVGSNGQATISIPIAADNRTEGSETLTVTAQGKSASVTINDTSLTPQPSYALVASGGAVNEGSSATFTLSTTNVAAGTAVAYTLSGVSSGDVVGGALSGSVNVGSNGQATISIPIAADNLTEGSETLTVTAQGKSASMTVNDTSLTPQTFDLSFNAASVDEGQSVVMALRTSGVAAGTSVAFAITGVDSGDISGIPLSGQIAIPEGGVIEFPFPIAADLKTEGPEVLTLSMAGQTATVLINDTSITPAPRYELTAVASQVDEGANATFVLSATNVVLGTLVPYSVSGVQAQDVVGGVLAGTVSIDATNQVTISIPIAADNLTEGSETLTVTAQGKSASVTINDTSLTPQPTYALSASAGTVQEGTSAQFLLATTNVAAGTSVAYTVSGVSSADVVGGVMSGTATVGTNGQATISIPIAADNLTEGSETLTVTAQGKSASVTVEDTSRAQFSNVTGVAASTASVDEGSVATFTVTSTNVDAGKQYGYTITGIDAVDLLTEELSGFVTIGATGTGTIQLPIASDGVTEGPETLTLTVEGKSGSIGINDTSKGTSSYTVTGLTSTVNEGEIANFTVQASNTAAGSAIPYKITGVAAADFANKSLEGIVVINSAGTGRIQLQIEADNLLEGDETFSVVVGDASGSMRIVDTSNPGKPFEQTNTVANETFVAPAGSTRFEIAARSDEVSVRSTDGGKTWVVTSKDTGADTLTGYKRIKLEDSTIALDFSPGETSYKSVMLIGAAFGKDFVPGYFGAGVSLFDSGSSMQDIAKLIADIGLIEQVIGDNSESAWVKHVYKNVVGAEPDLLTEAVFVNWLTTGAYSRGDLLALAADLPLLESQVDMTGYQTNGIVFNSFI